MCDRRGSVHERKNTAGLLSQTVEGRSVSKLTGMHKAMLLTQVGKLSEQADSTDREPEKPGRSANAAARTSLSLLFLPSSLAQLATMA
ncbi:hypothetical protein CEXT_471551 [Caerostris extrusa]|uniref:Uncharacterized protein n=1 Tax=Caerostris extrusa TaxID=172846 RepID=A0AAV4XLH7_CAEEX|nr:hypothetical protein CEXT_471551 [Caerostris extrusa]